MRNKISLTHFFISLILLGMGFGVWFWNHPESTDSPAPPEHTNASGDSLSALPAAAIFQGRPSPPSALPIPSATSQVVAATGVKPPSDSLVDHVYADAEVLARHERPLSLWGETERVTLLRTELKYPLIRVEDRIRNAGGPGPVEIMGSVAMAAGHVLVTASDSAQADDLEIRLAQEGWSLRARLPLSHHLLVELQLPEDDETTSQDPFPGLLARLREDVAGLATVEPDFLYYPSGLANDPSFVDGALWALRNTGQSGGTAGADINAEEAWDLRTDASSVVVAVIDTGVRTTHEDLIGNLWVNPGEIPGNGVDDDGNGVIDDVHGFDAIEGSGTPEDEDGHGTHVAGTIGASGNNTLGVTGVAWEVQIMPVRFLGNDGGFLSDAIESITYAQNNGATVFNNSWGGGGFSTALRDRISALEPSDILFVAAAGNDGQNNDTTPAYPASYNLPHIVSVAASDRNDRMAAFSNFGAASVDLVAPGVSILSTYFTSDTATASLNGTSMASPQVAGAAALLRAAFPGEDRLAIKARLLDTVDPLAAFATTTVSGGRLNLNAALLNQAAPQPGSFRFTATTLNVTEDGGSLPVSIRRVGGSQGAVSVRYRTVTAEAAAGLDFVAVDETLSWADGENADRVINLSLLDDLLVEGTESFDIELYQPGGGATLGSPERMEIRILDNEAAPLSGFEFTDADVLPAAFALAEPEPDLSPVPTGGFALAGIEFINGNVTLLLRRFSETGTLLWERSQVSAGGVFQPRITADTTGRIYVGYARITLNEFGQITEANPAAMAWSSTGQLLWDVELPEPSGQLDLVSAVTLDGNGDLYLGGEYALQGAQDAFLVRVDAATGTRQWSRVFKPHPTIDGADAVSSLAPAGSGGVWVGGWTTGASGFEGIIRHYDADGTLQVDNRLPTQGQQRVLSLAVNPFNELFAGLRSFDNVTGVFSGKMLRLSPNDGSVIWERGQAIGSSAANFLIASTVNGELDFIQGPFQLNGDRLYSVGRFNRDGERLFENNLDAQAPLSVTGMASTSDGGLVFVGAYNGIAQFGAQFLDSGGVNGAYVARLTLQDPLVPGTVEFENGEALVREGQGPASLTLLRRDGADGTVRVRIRSVSGSAISPADFTTIDTRLTFGPGQISQKLEIPITDDFQIEDDESFRLEISEPEGGALISTVAEILLRILDDDTAFDTWLSDFFEPGELNDPSVDDPDEDGLSVLLEYAFGLDPLVADIFPPLAIGRMPDRQVQFTYLRAAGREDLRFTPNISQDLKTWNSVTPLQSETEPVENGRERVTFTLPPPPDPDASLFFRILIERQTQSLSP